MPDVLHAPLPDNPLCLITDDGTSLAPTFAKALSRQGWTPAVLRFQGISDITQKNRKHFPAKTITLELTTLNEAELQTALKKLHEEHGNIGGCVHLHPSFDDASLKLEDGSNIYVKQAFLLAKNLRSFLKQASLNSTKRSPFIAVTRLDGQLGMGTGAFNSVSSGLSGLVKTASVEWPDVFCRFIDLAPKLSAETATEKLLLELQDPDLRLTEVGYTDKERMTVFPEKVRDVATTAKTKTAEITSETVFLVSGGARGVTAECIVQLAQKQPARFILLGRSPIEAEPEWARGCSAEAQLKQKAMQSLIAAGEKPTPVMVKKTVGKVDAGRAIRKTLDRIKQTGGQAEYVSADVTNQEQIKSAIAPVIEKFGNVTAVVHGAGVLADKLIEKKTAADYDAVCSTKINGLYALLNSVNKEQLTHLLLFSSAAGFYGNAGQSDYAMANETMNRVALQFKQNQPECHVTSFNWGPWEGGMVTPELKRLFEERDVEVISVEDGTRVFVEEVTSAGQKNPIVLIGNSMVVPNEPTDGFRNWKISRKITQTQNPVFLDHTIGETPVLPAVHAMAWMTDVCEQELPGYQLATCNNFKVLNGIKFDDTLANEYAVSLQETGRENGNSTDIDVKVSSLSGKLPRFHYSSQVRLVRKLQTDANYTSMDLSNSHNLQGSDFYQNGTLFHGPKFQGIEKVLNINEQKLTLECKLPQISLADQGQFPVHQFNPFASDLAFQAMLIWAWRFHQTGSLPLKTDSLEHFRKVPFEVSFFLSMEVNRNSSTSLNADLFLHDEQGQLYAKITGAEVTLSKTLNSLFGKTS